MGLLAPWFLGGLLAIGLPVYLHLLRRHKTTPVVFHGKLYRSEWVRTSYKGNELGENYSRLVEVDTGKGRCGLARDDEIVALAEDHVYV